MVHMDRIPYHYHVVGLRRIIAINSVGAKTTPRPIFDRWNDRINITLWNENGPTDMKVSLQQERKYHSINQRQFMEQCFTQLKSEGWDLAFHIDPDEYFMFNPRLLDRNDTMYNAHIPTANLAIAPISEPCSIANFLHDVEPFHRRGTHDTRYIYGGPCREFPRLQFSNYEDDQSRNRIQTIPGIATDQMYTHRYQYVHKQKVVVGKGIVALSQVNYTALKGFGTPHHPIAQWRTNQCSQEAIWGLSNASVVIHHYPSDWNSMMFRQNQQRYGNNATESITKRFKEEQVRNQNYPLGTDIQKWLTGFFEIMGEQKALKLLDMVSDPFGAAKGANIYWDYNATPDASIESIINGGLSKDSTTTNGGASNVSLISESTYPTNNLAACKAYTAACLYIMDENHRLIEWYVSHFTFLQKSFLVSSEFRVTSSRSSI